MGLLFLFAKNQLAFSQSEETIESNESIAVREDGVVKRGLIASGETLISNLFLMAFNIFISKEPWAAPTRNSIHNNLTLPWDWDNDGFKVNQIGHPYQGAIYHSFGRVNGFNFYESVFFSALGSCTWEVFFENNRKALNDFMTTTIGSMALGEMLFQLYLEADGAGAPVPLSFMINPAAGFHRIATSWKPQTTGKGNIYEFNTYLGMGWAQTNSSIIDSGTSNELFSFSGLIANIGFSTIYGNPFRQESFIPFEHFEFATYVGIDAVNYLSIRLISDGYLFSFAPIYTNKSTMSTGLSLHFDFESLGELDKYDSSVDQCSNAIDWTIKYQRLFGKNMIFQQKHHAGFTYLGVAESYSHTEWKGKKYGYGFNSKNIISLENKKVGKLEMSFFYYLLCGFYNDSLSLGNIHWFFIDGSYYHHLSKNLALGIADSFAMERGYYKKGFYDTKKKNNEVKFFAVWKN
ncbi:MAG: DUF3943 domain-containing protein [Spirochaetaceae bacterium]|nr:DUF3943 domain-containing protein [Spirochaetaceae bacterium]